MSNNNVNMDQQIREKINQKFDNSEQEKAILWIESLVGYSLVEKHKSILEHDATKPLMRLLARKTIEINNSNDNSNNNSNNHNNNNKPDLFILLKNGVILCDLIEKIQPKSCGNYAKYPKHITEYQENLRLFQAGCRKIGVESSDIVDVHDMSEAKANRTQLLDCIHAIARQAKAHNVHSNVNFGVNYYKTIEQQQQQQQRRQQEQQQLLIKSTIKKEQEQKRREELEIDDLNRSQIREEKHKSITETRQQKRSQKGLKYQKGSLKEAGGQKYRDHEDAVIYGMDRENSIKLESKENKEETEKVFDWIEVISNKMVDSWKDLVSGRILVDFINNILLQLHQQKQKQQQQQQRQQQQQQQVQKTKLTNSSPKFIKINPQKNPLKERENIEMFRQSCKQIGVKDIDIFDTLDLYKLKNTTSVSRTFFALSRLLESTSYYKGVLIPWGKTDFTIFTYAPQETTSGTKLIMRIPPHQQPKQQEQQPEQQQQQQQQQKEGQKQEQQEQQPEQQQGQQQEQIISIAKDNTPKRVTTKQRKQKKLSNTNVYISIFAITVGIITFIPLVLLNCGY